MRLLLATVWILIGSAITAGIYWGFLITPESTIWALMVSALLALVALAMVGLTANGALVILSQGVSAAGLRRALASVPSVIPAALIVLAVWWLTSRAETWVALRTGAINAWFIARFGWDDVSWLFSGVRYMAEWIRWVISALLALSLMAGIAAVGWRAIAQAAWLRRALRPRAVLVATLWSVALIALPWMFLVPWRPQNLPPSSIEFAFIVAKLSVSAILFACGAAFVAQQASANLVPALTLGNAAGKAGFGARVGVALGAGGDGPQ
jgi:hypothetical protein